MSTTLNRQWFRIAGTKTKTPHVKPTTNEALVGEYLSWKRSYSKSAHRAYSVWVKRFQTFTNKPPEFFRHTDYTAFAELLHANYAPRGVEFALNVVHNYLRYFAEQGRLTFPMYLVRVPKGASRSHPAFTENEYLQLTASMREIAPLPLRDLAIIMLLHDTGMRIGELLSLHISDIGSDKSAVIKTEKTVRLRRIFWNEDTDAILHDYLIERVNDGTDHSEYLFPQTRASSDRALCSRTVQRNLKRYLERAGLSRRLCLHSFRHSFIHRLAKLGVPDAIIAQLVGHSTPLTVSHYTKLSRPEFREYAERQLAFARVPPELQLAAY